MPDRADQLIDDLLKTLDTSVERFNKSIPGIQKQVFAKVIELAGQLETAYRRIKPSVTNLRLITRLRAELEKIVVSKPYLKRLDEFTAAFNAVEKINTSYFSLINKQFKPSRVFAEIKKQAIGSTVDSLTGAGIGRSVTDGIRDILRQNITAGGKMADFVDQMRGYLTDTKVGDGALVRYAKQITTDAINQYSASYTELATSDLGLTWYQYTGSLITTSREWCREMIDSKSGCQRYIHRSQFQTLINGLICGNQVPIYKKTGLPHGMIEGTNPDNLIIRRGGYSCGHQLIPVSSAIVPKHLREQFE